MSVTRNFPSTEKPPVAPWWRYGMVWLVISGPLVVVVAATITAVIAVRGADPVITDIPAAMTPGSTTPSAQTPAMQARNHVATSAPR